MERVDHGQGDERCGRERYHDPPPDAEVTGPVDPGGVEQLLGQGAEAAATART